MSPEVILLLFLLIAVPICVAVVWYVRHLLNKYDNWKGPVFAPTTAKDSPYGYGFMVMVCLTPVAVMGMHVFNLAYPWIRPISEITPHNGPYVELSVTMLVLLAFVATRYISVFRVLFFSFLLVFLLLAFLFGRDVANVQWDTSTPVQFTGTVVDKKVTTGGRKSGSPVEYSLYVQSHANGETFEVPVSQETLQTAAVGDSVSVETRDGFFKRRWASGRVAVLKPTRK